MTTPIALLALLACTWNAPRLELARQGILREIALTPLTRSGAAWSWRPFPDIELTLTSTGARSGQLAGRIFEFDLEHEPGGWARFVLNQGVLVGDVVSPARGSFAVRTRADGSLVTQQIERGVHSACGGQVRARRTTSGQVLPSPSTSPAASSGAISVGPLPSVAMQPIDIDVLVMHTPAVLQAAGGRSGVEAIAESHVAYTNGVYADSGVRQRLRLAGVAETPYTETFNTILDLTRLQDPNDGIMDDVHPLRDALAADCVVLLVEVGAAGVGYLMDDVSADFEDRAFSVVRYDAGPIAFAHELGHNMGASHNNGPGVAAAAFCDSFGYRTPDNQWRTIMSNAPGQHVDFFSSPSLSFGGFPLGVDGANCPLDAADSVRTFNATAETVAGFRP